MRTTSVTSTNSDKNSKIISFKMPNERGKKLPLVNMG